MNLRTERDTLFYIPERVADPAPFVLYLHGATGGEQQGIRRLRALADEFGFLLLSPASQEFTWDAIRSGYAGGDSDFIGGGVGQDDVGVDPVGATSRATQPDGTAIGADPGRIPGDRAVRPAEGCDRARISQWVVDVDADVHLAGGGGAGSGGQLASGGDAAGGAQDSHSGSPAQGQPGQSGTGSAKEST